MSSEGGGEAEPLSAVATIEKGTVKGVGVTAAGSSTPNLVQLVRENSGHFVTLSVTPLATELANYLLFTLKYLQSFLEYPANNRQMAGKLTRIL